MRITAIREVSVPLSGAVSNAVVSFTDHRVSLVAVVSDVIRDGKPLTGIAFNSIGRHAQGGILRERLIPRVMSAPPESLVDTASGLIDPGRVLATMLAGEKPGGHGDRATAAAVVELACWDLLAKYHDEPAYRTIADSVDREPSSGAPVYAAGGYYREGQGLTELRAEMAGYLDAGYTAVKIKIGGADLADDLARVEAAVNESGSGAHVAVDANGRFDATTAVQYARELAPLNLRWYEEPVDPLDFHAHSLVAQEYPAALATGENLFSVPDTTNLLRFAGLRPDRDILQMDAGLSYGLTEYMRMIEQMEAFGFPRASAMPHGGHLINLHIVVGLGLGGCEAYPGVFAPFGGYSPDCVLADGRIHAGESPGFGLEAKPELSGLIRELIV